MKLRCERDILVETVTTSSRAVSSRAGGAQALSGLLLRLNGDLLHVTGSDSDLDLVIECDTRVAGLEDGDVVADARLLTEIVRAFDVGAVSLEADEDEVRLSSGRSQFGVRTYPPEDYPKFADTGSDGMKIRAAELADALRQVVRAASKNDMRQHLTGVLFSCEDEGLRLVATDSYRLAMRDLGPVEGSEPGSQSVVPARALAELQRLIAGGDERFSDVSFHEHELHAVFDLAGVRVRTRLIKVDFPQYRQLIPASYPNRATIPKHSFLDALRRMRVMVVDDTSSVRVSFSSESIRLMVTHPDTGRADEEVDGKYEGADITVAFNPSYLIDGVDAVTSDEVVLETVDASKPAMVRGVEGDEFRYLLMPVRIP